MFQSGEAFTVEGNKHTHSDTDTHTHTHTHTIHSADNRYKYPSLQSGKITQKNLKSLLQWLKANKLSLNVKLWYQIQTRW